MRIVQSLLAVVIISIFVSACGRPASVQVREGDDPFHQDDDVVFRTTYYFRTFDYCVLKKRVASRGGETGAAVSIKVPVSDALYRFRMTGKASTLLSNIHFESGILKSWEIDPLGAAVVFDKNLGRHRFVSQQESSREADRKQAENDYQQLLADYEKIARGLPEEKDENVRKLHAELLGNLSAAIKQKLALYSEVGNATDAELKQRIAAIEQKLEESNQLTPEDKAALVKASQPASIHCPDDAPVRRGFQILGPEGWRTFDQDERVMLVMSTDAEPLISTMKELSQRVLNAKASESTVGLRFAKERQRIFEARDALATAGSKAPPATTVKAAIDALKSKKKGFIVMLHRTIERFTWSARLIGCLLPLALSGCATDGRLDSVGLSGSSSMRVEVEVYKGPLAYEKEIQGAQLEAKLEDTQRAARNLLDNHEITLCRMGCNTNLLESPVSHVPVYARRNGVAAIFSQGIQEPRLSHSCAELHARPDNTTTETDRHRYCPIVSALWRETKEVIAHIASILPDDPRENWILVKDLLAEEGTSDAAKNARNTRMEKFLEAARLGENMKARANYWATAHAAVVPESTRVRIVLAQHAQFASAYGNQLNARADALMKQERGAGRLEVLRDQFSTGIYLRDSDTTAYLNLNDWNKAAVERDGVSATDRIRIVEQLVRDSQWSKVNTVFAAGQGETHVALIKDDIGNWNIKSFDNKPGELVNAYKDTGLAVLKKVADATSGGATSAIEKANALAKFSKELSYGETPPVKTDASATRLRDRIVTSLNQLATEQQGLFEAKHEVVIGLDGELKSHEEEVKGLKSETATAKQNESESEQRIAALQAARRILEESRAPTAEDGNDGRMQVNIDKIDKELVSETAKEKELEATRQLSEQKLANAEARRAQLQEKSEMAAAEKVKIRQQTLSRARQILQLHEGLLTDLESGTLDKSPN